MSALIDVKLEDFMGKEFVTAGKAKNYSEEQYLTKDHFLNIVNKNFACTSNSISTNSKSSISHSASLETASQQ